MPSASRIDALSGSSRFAFSSATVACAAMPPFEVVPALLEEVVRVAHRWPQVGEVLLAARRAGASGRASAPISTAAICSPASIAA